MKNIEFIPIDYDYFDFKGQNFVKMIGRDGNGKKVCVIDSYEANFYLILKDGASEEKVIEKIKDVEVSKGGRVSRILRTEVLKKRFLERDVKAIRVWVSNHKDAHEIASKIGDLEDIEFRREYDIPIITKYIKEKNVNPLVWQNIEVENHDALKMVEGLNVDECFFAKKISEMKKQKEFVPKILAYDIETSGREIGEGEIFMISLFGKKMKRVLTWKKVEGTEDYTARCASNCGILKHVEFCENEAYMLERFSRIVREYDADILVGYFSDGFDLPYIKARADKFRATLDLGVNGRGPTFTRGRISSGKISGLVHVDLYRFIDAVFSQYLQSETLSLNEVAKELVGMEKGDFDFSRLKDMKNEDWNDFFSYNLQDSAATYELMLKLWDDAAEFSHIVKEPVFDITRDRMATHVENHILHNLDRFNEIAEKRPGHQESGERKMKRKFEGAFVLEPKPGFYEDIVMFDFTSMHASLIVSFNISGQTLKFEKKGNVYTAPEFEVDGKQTQVYFDKRPGFFSTLLSEIVEKRKEAKDYYKKDGSAINKAKSNAYKLLANATFGYQGFFGARYYSYEAAAATLAYVRKYNSDMMNKIREEGFEVIYGDTDSVAFLRNGKSEKGILKFLKDLNEELPGIMELDLEGFFKHGIFVAKRGKTSVGAHRSVGSETRIIGAKKKYALINEDGKIKIRGFETVRRDWCGMTRELQDKVLRMILKDGNEKGALKLARETISKLKAREVDLESLIIRTKLKRDVGDYVAEGPHVIAAKKMISKGIDAGIGTFVEYYIGEGVGKRVGDRVFLRSEKVKYDVEYYLNKQVLPAIEGIFDVFGVDVRGIADGETQKTLF